jgi:predicted lipid-binding transport protein (Tim44 family)
MRVVRRLLHHPLTWIVVVLLVSAIARARPGGGSSFSGGSHGGGGSSSGDDFIIDCIFLLLQLCVEYPKVGLPILGTIIVVGVLAWAIKTDGGRAVVGVVFIIGTIVVCIVWPPIGLSLAGAGVLGGAIFAIFHSVKKKPPEWSTTLEAPARSAVRSASPRNQLEKLRERDPDFSLVVFEDFFDALYTELQHARKNDLDRYAAWLSPKAREALTPAAVEDVIVGAMRIVDVSVADRVDVEIDFEANYTSDGHACYVRDRWGVSRKATAKSKPPDKARIFECPNCGAALESVRGGTCTYCKQQVATGDFDWRVERIINLDRESRGPILTEQAPEVGTDSPTIVDANLETRKSALTQKDPAFSDEALGKRIRLTFETMQVAWSSLEWLKARPYLSDRLFQAQLYWIEAYRTGKLRNLNDDTRIERIELVRVTSDKWFDGVTVRLYASGFDYTVDEKGALVCGSKSSRRRYSEYWTLIRGAQVRGAPRAEPVCPNCGASTLVNMAGNCEHCKARLTLGEFDWVLSRIEQDEVYGA